MNIIEINFNKVFMLSDLHFGVRSNSLEWLVNQKDFFYNWYIPFLKNNIEENDILLILGDWFDNRQSLDIYVMNESIKIIHELSKIIPIHFLTGNHDIYKKVDTDINSLISFYFIDNIFIYEKPVILTNNKTKLLIIPWIGDKETEESIVNSNNADYVFMHTNLDGFKYDNGREITNGVNISNKNIKRVFSGHIHKRQENKKFIYIGSPYHTKRSDINNIKGAYILDTINNKILFTINNYSPIFQRIYLSNILDKTVEEISAILNNNYSDIIIPANLINLFNITKFNELFKDTAFKKIEADIERKNTNEIDTLVETENIKDILTLINDNINMLNASDEIKNSLKEKNQYYYELANKNDI